MYRDLENTTGLVLPGSDETVVGFSPVLWRDLDDRFHLYSHINKDSVHISTYLFTDATVSNEPLILNDNVSCDISCYFNSPERALLMDKPDSGQPVVELLSCELVVPRIIPLSNSIPRSLSHQYLRLNILPVYIPANVTNHHSILTFSSHLPTRLTLRFTSMTSWDGDYKSNPFHSSPFNVEEISYHSSGMPYPSSPCTADFGASRITDLYLRSAEALRFSHARTGITMPSLQDYSSSDFSYSVDLSPDGSADSHWISKQGDGSLSLSLKFSKPTPHQIVALVLAETISMIRIQKDGLVTTE